MKEKLKDFKPIQNMMVLALLVLLLVLTFQTSALAQNPAPVPKTGQTQSYAAGDDGDLQMGVQWPDPRFTDNGDGTVTDHLTGLIWLKKADCFAEHLDWGGALDVCNNLGDGDCGLSDGSNPGEWRMPNVRELYSLIDHANSDPALPAGHPFVGVRLEVYRQVYCAAFYWTATRASERSPLGTGAKVELRINMGTGSIEDMTIGDEWYEFSTCLGASSHSVWPVRGGSCPHPIGHWDYCQDCGPCTEGQGDCDTDNECASGLVCDYTTPGVDYCKPSCPHPIGHLDYCRDCGPCAPGQGDCDNNSECQSGLTCVLVPGTDTCQ